MDAKPGLGLAVLLLALPLAGCTAPSSPPAASAPPPAARSPEAPASVPALRPLLASDRSEGNSTDCRLQPERTQDIRLHEVVLQVRGCILANEPRLLDGLPEDPRVLFDVGQGAVEFVAQLHLHGAERMVVQLRDPQRNKVGDATVEGNEDVDSLAVFTVAKPEPGSWRVNATLHELALQRHWTLTVVTRYP